MDSSTAAAEPSKKIKRTYGRKKDANDVDQVSGVSSTTALPARRLFLDLPIQGEGCTTSSEGQSTSDLFGLREKLNAIDKAYDEELPVPIQASLSKPRAAIISTSPVSTDVDLSSTQDISLQSIFENPAQPLEIPSPSIAKLNKSMKATSIKTTDVLGSQTSMSSQAYASQISESPKAQESSTPLTSENENVLLKDSHHDSVEKVTRKRARKDASEARFGKGKPGSVKVREWQ